VTGPGPPRPPGSDPGNAGPPDERASRITDLAAARAAVAVPEVVELGGHPDAYHAEDVLSAYDAFQHELFSFAFASTRSSDAAEDLVQDTFERLIEVTAAGNAPTNTRAWLYRVLANLVTSRGRRRLVAVRNLPFLVRRDSTEAAEDAYLRGQVDQRIPAALESLSDLERTALLLAARGLPGRDVAAAIGRSEAATRTLMCRARLRIRKQLDPDADR
jgi:RNA polymerase sigma-70 factor (ECF subfamily)